MFVILIAQKIENENSPSLRPGDRQADRAATHERVRHRDPGYDGRKAREGAVIAVGSGELLQDGTQRPLQLRAGDHVLFGKYAGQSVKVDGDELLVVREEDVMGIFEHDEVEEVA